MDGEGSSGAGYPSRQAHSLALSPYSSLLTSSIASRICPRVALSENANFTENRHTLHLCNVVLLNLWLL